MKHFLRNAIGTARQVGGQVQTRRRLAGEDSRPRGRADGLGAVGAGKTDALLRETIEVRSVVVLAAIAMEIVNAEVIAENEEDIRGSRFASVGRLRLGCECKDTDKNQR